MGTLAQSVAESRPLFPWFWEFLKEELAPYPGRAGTVARMVIAVAFVTIIYMTFRLQYGYQGAVYVLIISRDNPRATLESSRSMLLVTVFGAAYVLLSVWFVISFPALHFLWNIGSFFLVFYALSAMTNFAGVLIFAFMIALGIPLWDRHVSAETNVEDILRVVLAGLIGVVVTAAVELVFARRKPGDDVVLPIGEQLAVVKSLLTCYIENRPVDRATEEKIIRLEMVGTSRLRRLLRRSNYSSQYRGQMNGVVSLAGRLVDIAATLTKLSFKPSALDQKQLRKLATAVESIRGDLINGRIPGLIHFDLDVEVSTGVPLLLEMEKTVALIPNAFGSGPMDEYVSTVDDAPQSKLFVPDALTNPEHFKFALKGCLAASLCYIIYNGIAWPGISTAVTTCLLTGLSTIGASHQKQILRITGATVGGFLFGMGSQIFILPYLDSIFGFTVLIVLVTAVASWFMTASSRLSYFGLQMALAFYLVNLQEFGVQTSLSIARDRVVGVLLGLFMMWLVFDHLGGARTAVEMKKTFISNLRSLAQLEREPLSGEKSVAIERSYALRETISTQFDQMRALADGVLFEFGPSRQEDLALRDRIRRWGPQLRTFFLIRVALLKYRMRLAGFDLPEPVELAQREFDEEVAKVLDGMADRMAGKISERKDGLERSHERLEETIRSCRSEGSQELLTAKLQTFLALSRSIETLTMSLNKEI